MCLTPIFQLRGNQLNGRDIQLLIQFPISISPQPGIEDIGNSKPGSGILNKIPSCRVQRVDVEELPGHAVQHAYRTLSGVLSGDPLVRPHEMSSHLPNSHAQAEAVQKARAIVSGELGVLEGCIPLASLAHKVVPDWRTDPDFVVFGAVASEVDDLPFGPVRARWSGEALAKADIEIARYTRESRDQVMAACHNIINRFAFASSHGGAV